MPTEFVMGGRLEISHVTVCFSPVFQTVFAIGFKIGGDMTSRCMNGIALINDVKTVKNNIMKEDSTGHIVFLSRPR